MNIDMFELAFSALIVVIGWYVGHYFSWQREQNSKERDTRVTYLQSTYRDLIRLRSYAKVLKIDEVGALLVGVLSDIELYGTNNQVNLARELAKEIDEGGKFGLSETLIDDLRDDLRSELGLEVAEGSVTYFDLEIERTLSELSYDVLSTGEKVSYHPVA
jgi:hypothetical protein